MAQITPFTGQPTLEETCEVSRARTLVNAGANYGQYFVSMLAGIFLQAYIVRKLGREEYAIWPLVASCLAFIGLMQTGIGSGTARFLADALGRKDVDALARVTSSVFFVMLIGAGVYAGAVICVSVSFEDIFDIPQGTAGTGPWVLLIAGVAGATAMPFSVFYGGLIASQSFVWMNVLAIARTLSRVTLIVAVFAFGMCSLIWVASVDLILGIVYNVAIYVLARRLVPWQRVSLRWFDLATFRRVNGFSILLLVSSVAMMLYWHTDNIIINKLLGPSLVTGYFIVANMFLAIHRVTSLGVSVLAPSATVLHAKGDVPRLARLLFRANRTIVPFTTSGLWFLVLYGRQVLRAYVGSGYEENAVLFPILGVAFIFSGLQNSAAIVPQAYGKWTVVCLMSLFVAAANVVISLFLVIYCGWGVCGVAAGTAFVTVTYKLLFWPWYTARLLRICYAEYFRQTILVPLANSAPFVLTTLGFALAGHGQTLAGVVAVFGVAAGLEAFYMIIWGLHASDRETLRQYAGRATKRIFLCQRNARQ